MAGLQYAGEFSLDKCELISSAGVTVDISSLIVEINIFEDIFAHSLNGSIIIGDTNNLVDNMPIVGQEFIALKITTPGMAEQKIDFSENVFCLHEIGVRQETTTSSEMIELRICTPELLRNHRTRISKSYEETIDKIVQSVLENEKYVNTKKDIFVEPTQGIRKIISPNYHPFHFIRNLTRESISAKNNSPHYLFFENIFGYHFRSLQSLYEDGVQGEFHCGDKGFDEKYSSSSDAGKIAQSFKRVLAYQVPNKNNSLYDIRGGMLGSTLIMHDIYNKKYTKSTFNYFENHDEYQRIEPHTKYNQVLIDDVNDVGSFTDSRIHLHPTSITENDKDSQYMEVPPPTADELIEQGVDRGLALAAVAKEEEQTKELVLFRDEEGALQRTKEEEQTKEENKDYMSNRADKWLLQRQQRVHELNSGAIINMSVNGNASITIGQVIKISVPIHGADHENTGGVSKHQSGLYLVSKVRHTFSPPTKTHRIHLQATKDASPIELQKKASGAEPKKSGKSRVYQL